MKLNFLLGYSLFTLQLLFFTGCQSSPSSHSNLPHSSIPATGSSLITHSDILIPPEQAHIYIQNGQIMTVNGVNLYSPHCKLRVKNTQPKKQRITADRFAIVELQRYTDFFFLVNMDRIQIAGPLTIESKDGALAEGDLGDIMYITELKLHSEQQPQVSTLLCQQLDDPALGDYASTAQIIETLGEIASLDMRPQ